MTAQTEVKSPPRSLDKTLAAAIALLALVVLFFGSVRYRLRNMPLERDEGEYAYAGQLLLQGIPPYSLAYNMKLPGIYAAYAIVLAAFGETAGGIHLGLLMLNAATIVVLFFLAFRLFGSMTAAIAASSYALLSTSASVMGFEAHATHFVVLPALLGILLLLEGLSPQRSYLLFWSGVLLGAAVLMKQHGVFFLLFAFVYLGVENRRDWRLLMRQAAVLAAGAVLPYALTCFLMYRAGVFHQFWFWTVNYAGEYAKMGLRRAIRAFLENSQVVIGPSFLIWILAAVGLIAVFWSPAVRRHRRFLLALLICSFFAICPGAYFRPHYYVLLLPIISLLAGVAVSATAEKWERASGKRSGAAIAVLVFAVCFGISVFLQRKTYFSQSPDEVVQSIYGNTAFVPAVTIAKYIRDHSAKNTQIAVIGSEPEIYFYADRHSATGYLFMYSLIVHHKYSERMRAEMLQELEATRAPYAVYVDAEDDWGGLQGGPQLASFLQRLHEFMSRNYQVVGIADIGMETRYFWDAEAANYHPASSKVIYVLKRKDAS